MLDDYCVSVVNKCFLALYCVEFGTNSEVTTLPCIKKLVYGFIFQIKRPLVFPGVSFLFFAELEETHSPACYFLPGQTSKIYGQLFFFFFKLWWVVGRAGGRVLVWFGTCYRPTCPGTHV